MTRKVYIAGHCLDRGSQLQRAEEREIIEGLGHQLYNPMDNKEINDKATAIQEGLAERIVKHDTDAIMWADTILIEPLPHAIGTNIELGQVKGMKDLAKEILRAIDESRNDMEDSEFALWKIAEICHDVNNKKVIAHYSDIRRVPGITETGDRRSLGVHQYMYGVVLDLTDGKGFTEQDRLAGELV